MRAKDQQNTSVTWIVIITVTRDRFLHNIRRLIASILSSCPQTVVYLSSTSTLIDLAIDCLIVFCLRGEPLVDGEPS